MSSSSEQSNYCRLCKTTTPTHLAWLTHLVSSVHQMMMRIAENHRRGHRLTDRWDKSRALVISNCFQVPARSILEYMDSWGPVENFSYLSKTDGVLHHCHILMRNKMNANSVSGFSKPHLVSVPQGKAIVVQRWSGKKDKKQVEPEIRKERDRATLIDSHSSSTHSSNVNAELESTTEPLVSPIPGHFPCSTCNTVSYTLSEWASHLISTPHRKFKTSEVSMGLKTWDYQKGVLLQGVNGLSRIRIIAWALNWGHVTDFIDPAKEDKSTIAYLLFQKKENVDALLNFKDYQIISYRRIDVLPIPEFSGYAKLEKQMLKAEKLASEMISITPSSTSTHSSTNQDDEDHKEEAECRALISLLEKNLIENQLALFMKHNTWSDSVYEKADSFIRNVLIVNVIKRLELPENTTCQILPYGAYGCRTGINKGPPKLHLQLNIISTLDSSFDIDAFPTQVELVHKLRVGLESILNVSPGSIRTLSPDASNRPTLIFLANMEEQKFEFHLRIDSNNILASQESSLIVHYCNLDPRVRPLLLIILQWNELFSQVQSTDEIFPTHLISVMVLFFLIHKKIVPSVHELCARDDGNESNAESIWFQGYDISFSKCRGAIKHHPELSDQSILALSVLALLKEFFHFYGWVDMNENVFCVRLGSLISKDLFFTERRSDLPNEIKEIYSNGEGQLYTVSPLVVQDPLVLSLNLSKSRGRKIVCFRFSGMCRKVFQNLEASFNEEQPSLEALFKNVYKYTKSELFNKSLQL